MTVWKFVIPIDDLVRIAMPLHANPLTVEMQNGQLCVWALVDEDARQVMHTFYVRGTGHPMREAVGMRYVGTVHGILDRLVFHVFDGGEQ